LERAWLKWRQFDPARGTPKAWLLAIVYDQARKRRRRHGPPSTVYPYPVGGHELPVERHVDLTRAISRLSNRQRLAVTLFYYLGLPVHEAALVMQCAPGTVKSTLSDARTRLESLLGEDYGS
jgi:RNA polymerase sigma-70 factor (ECF subfamily)